MNKDFKELLKKLQKADEEVEKKQKEESSLDDLYRDKDAISKKLDNKILKLKEQIKQMDDQIPENEEMAKKSAIQVKELIEKRTDALKKVGERITLNIGGKSFLTTKTTLFSQENLFFFLFSSGEFKAEKNGEYFIDRSPLYFAYVLDYLRGNEIDFESVKNKNDLVKEFDFYQIQIAEVDILFELEKAKKSIENRKKTKEENYEAQLKRVQMIKEGKYLIEVQKIDTKLTVTNNDVLSKDFKRSGAGDNCGVLFSKSSKWKLTIKNNCSPNGLMIGVAPNTFNCATSQYSACGHYIHTGSSTKYAAGISSQSFQSLVSKCDNDGSVIIMTYKNGTLSYNVNGKDLGVAFTGIATDLFPAITYIYNDNSQFSVEFME